MWRVKTQRTHRRATLHSYNAGVELGRWWWQWWLVDPECYQDTCMAIGKNAQKYAGKKSQEYGGWNSCLISYSDVHQGYRFLSIFDPSPYYCPFWECQICCFPSLNYPIFGLALFALCCSKTNWYYRMAGCADHMLFNHLFVAFLKSTTLPYDIILPHFWWRLATFSFYILAIPSFIGWVAMSSQAGWTRGRPARVEKKSATVLPSSQLRGSPWK